MTTSVNFAINLNHAPGGDRGLAETGQSWAAGKINSLAKLGLSIVISYVVLKNLREYVASLKPEDEKSEEALKKFCAKYKDLLSLLTLPAVLGGKLYSLVVICTYLYFKTHRGS